MWRIVENGGDKHLTKMVKSHQKMFDEFYSDMGQSPILIVML